MKKRNSQLLYAITVVILGLSVFSAATIVSLQKSSVSVQTEIRVDSDDELVAVGTETTSDQADDSDSASRKIDRRLLTADSGLSETEADEDEETVSDEDTEAVEDTEDDSWDEDAEEIETYSDDSDDSDDWEAQQAAEEAAWEEAEAEAARQAAAEEAEREAAEEAARAQAEAEAEATRQAAAEEAARQAAAASNSNVTSSSDYDYSSDAAAYGMSSEAYLLACTISAEVGSSSYNTQLAVANVILDRSYNCGSIRSAVFAAGQFSVTWNGALLRVFRNGPSSLSVQAAQDALNGADNRSQPYYYFNNVYMGYTGEWIGDEYFYLVE